MLLSVSHVVYIVLGMSVGGVEFALVVRILLSVKIIGLVGILRLFCRGYRSGLVDELGSSLFYLLLILLLGRRWRLLFLLEEFFFFFI